MSALGYGVFSGGVSVNFDNWLQKYISEAKYTFLFEGNPSNPSQTELSPLNIFLGILMIIAGAQKRIMGVISDLCIFYSALILWTLANSLDQDVHKDLRNNLNITTISHIPAFERSTKEHINTSAILKTPISDMWRSYYTNFQGIQTVADTINQALGSQVTWCLADDLLYYSTGIQPVMFKSSHLERFRYVLFYALNIGTWFICADICSKMDCLKQWLKKDDNIEWVSQEQANLVLHEAITNEIGIRGSNTFTITFSFLAGLSTKYLYISVL